MTLKKTIVYIVVFIIAIILVNVLSSALYTVEENEYACVVRFSKIIDTVSSAGLHLKVPFIDEVRYFPKTKLLYDLPPSDVLTLDSKAMSVDSFVVWQITDPLLFFQTLGSIDNAENRLDANIYNVLKNMIGTISQNDIISASDEQSRGYVNVDVTKEVKQTVGMYGIDIIDVKIKKFELPAENENSVFMRMISDRNMIAELYRAEGIQEANMIKNEVDKKVNIIVSDAEARAKSIIADGESEYMRILAEAYNTPDRQEFYTFMRGLDALKESLKGGNKTVILDKDSQLAQILVNP